MNELLNSLSSFGGYAVLAGVLLFQYDHCSAVDGIVGAETRGKLT